MAGLAYGSAEYKCDNWIITHLLLEVSRIMIFEVTIIWGMMGVLRQNYGMLTVLFETWVLPLDMLKFSSELKRP